MTPASPSRLLQRRNSEEIIKEKCVACDKLDYEFITAPRRAGLGDGNSYAYFHRRRFLWALYVAESHGNLFINKEMAMRTYDLTNEIDAGDAASEDEETELQYLVRKLWGPRSNARFAQACRVHPKTASRWLNGRMEVPEPILEKLRGWLERVDPYLDDVLELAEEIQRDSGLEHDIVASLFRRTSVKL
jgi:hypothetical protein